MQDFFSQEKLKQLPLVGPWFEKARPRVAVLRLSGVIGESSGRRGGIFLGRYEKLIERAFSLFNIRAVALAVNCPGGAPGQTELVAGRIRQFADEKEIPVYAFVEDVAASGGYWLACAADRIYAQESSVVGSIGVVFAGFGLDQFIQRYGIERRIHTAGSEKSFMDPFLPEKKKDVERLRDVQGEIHAAFKDWVRARRGDRLTGSDKDLFEGQIWTGQQAQAQGIIDGLGDVRSVMRSIYGQNVRLVPLTPEKGFLAALTGGARAARDPAGPVLDLMHWQRYGLEG